jgi:hypothetical protein
MHDTAISSPAPDQCAAGVTHHTIELANGLTGLTCVLSLLRQRRYDVRHVHADLTPGRSEVTVSVLDTPAGAQLLALRLERLPAVVAVHGRDR